jgi:hypothetical protein
LVASFLEKVHLEDREEDERMALRLIFGKDVMRMGSG